MTEGRFSIIVRKRAASQIERANSWWRTNRPGNVDLLANEAERAFDLISRQPGAGAPAQSQRLDRVR